MKGVRVPESRGQAREASAKTGASFRVPPESTLIALCQKHGLHIYSIRELECAWQFRMTEGPIINIFCTVLVQLRGRNKDLAYGFVEDLQAEIIEIRHRMWLAGR